MKVVAFHGSPRAEGNSHQLLKSAVRGAEESGAEVRLFRLASMSMTPCLNCGGCDESGICVLDDEMTAVYSAIREADRIVLASPIFFFALSAQTKIMIDRCQAFWCEKYLLKKPIPAGPYGRKGLLLLVGGMKKEEGIKCAEASARAFFRTVSVPEHKTLSYLGIDAFGHILNHPTALTDAYETGKNLVTASA
ncbi:MAG: flavodoxin family protein [Nitrospirae bacterium]|nr:MAG: flavodoxin family protein [Nitrospirota bacterium]